MLIYRITPLLLLLVPLLTQCNEQKEGPATPSENNGPGTTTTTPEAGPQAGKTIASASGSGDLIGTWKLQLDAFDDNNNGLLDPEERAKATGNTTSYQFKPDGSCVIQGMFKGRYELKKENGHDNVIVYRKKIEGEEDDDPQPEKFRILSVSGSELVLLMQENSNENTIWIFKRV